MSKKATFKRIALIAVASMGLGVLSATNSSAGIYTSDPALALVQNGTANVGAADSLTAATFTLKWSTTSTTDTIVVKAVQIAGPESNAAHFYFVDTATSFSDPLINGINEYTGEDSALVTTGVNTTSATAGFNSITMGLQLDSATLDTSNLGTFTYRVTVYPHDATTLATTKIKSLDVSVVVSRTTAQSQTASAATSTAYISTTASNTGGSSDSVPSVLSTASATPRAYIYVNLLNASGAAAVESLTVTTDVGLVGTSSLQGKSVVLPYSAAMDVNVYSDGTAGKATITIKSTSVTFANKNVVFYSANPATLVASVINSVPGIGSTTAIAVDAKDSNGLRWSGTLYTYSSATGVISNDGASCSYVAARDRHECSVTGVTAGSADITVRNKSTVALSTVASNVVSLTTKSASAATVKLAWDKASYAPGEKATLLVSVLDSAGNSLPSGTYANLFATGGITFNQAAGNASDTVTPVSVTTSSLAAAALGTSTIPVKAYTIYMPATGGTMTASATGGVSLPLAGQVAVTASATVTDSGTQALAAVTALASQVSAFITKINAQITTLTDLVMKIQKKVKA